MSVHIPRSGPQPTVTIKVKIDQGVQEEEKKKRNPPPPNSFNVLSKVFPTVARCRNKPHVRSTIARVPARGTLTLGFGSNITTLGTGEVTLNGYYSARCATNSRRPIIPGLSPIDKAATATAGSGGGGGKSQLIASGALHWLRVTDTLVLTVAVFPFFFLFLLLLLLFSATGTEWEDFAVRICERVRTRS